MVENKSMTGGENNSPRSWDTAHLTPLSCVGPCSELASSLLAELISTLIADLDSETKADANSAAARTIAADPKRLIPAAQRAFPNAHLVRNESSLKTTAVWDFARLLFPIHRRVLNCL